MKIDKVSIKDYTTYKLTGKMKLFVPKDISELKEILKKDRCKIIGNGSNLIIDKSYDKTLVKLQHFDDINICGNIVDVGSGYSLSKLSRKCADNALSGLEFACGIPGTVGGAIYMNAGAYGHEIFDVLNSITVLDEKLQIIEICKKDLKSSYRNSLLKDNNYICLKAQFKLDSKKSEIIKRDIINIMEDRRKKQPLEYPSAGSVFKNPKGYSAGRLIEKSGLKGLSVNDASISEKHANFIINKGNASSDDVIKLINIIKDKIKKEYGIDLELEQEILKG
ncbi:MAG: UDP-N-acetylmuramate dehydrogenase [Bacilli bacterium]|nr:UDP-N-acetylmuramate dehydrogenase [Bacilli bacterium]